MVMAVTDQVVPPGFGQRAGNFGVMIHGDTDRVHFYFCQLPVQSDLREPGSLLIQQTLITVIVAKYGVDGTVKGLP